MRDDQDEAYFNTMIHLSLNTPKLIEKQEDDIYCKTVIKLICEEKMSSQQPYFINKEQLLQKFVREDDKYFHAVVFP